MTIHSEHPFQTPAEQRDVVRQFRGRLPAAVTIVTTGSGAGRVGLTVSSMLVVEGDPTKIVAMVDPDSNLGESLAVGSHLAISVLTTGDGMLADQFAGLAPTSGGLFSAGGWADTDFGPIRAGASWLGARVVDLHPVGWSIQVTGDVDHVELVDAPALIHARGRYRV